MRNVEFAGGCPYENFKDVAPVNENEPVFHTKSNNGAAYIEYRHSHFHEKIIRSMSCMVFLPGSDDLVLKRTVCEFCFKTEHYLRTQKSRYYDCRSHRIKDDESTAKLKPGQTFAVMSKEELLKITRQQSSELKALHKRVKRLEECTKKMSDVGEKNRCRLPIYL